MGMSVLKVKYHVAAALRIALFRLLFGSGFRVGKGTTFRRFFNVYVEKGARISIGKDCFFNHGCSLNALRGIEIGDGCIFGENVKIYDHNHRFSDPGQKIRNQGFAIEPVRIGDHCWFGSNVVILKGARIGKNCVIGAGCVIDSDVPDDTVVRGGRKLVLEARKGGLAEDNV